jgi:hypothetical protein
VFLLQSAAGNEVLPGTAEPPVKLMTSVNNQKQRLFVL